MKGDSELQSDVISELEWDPIIDHAGIGVSVTDGVVALNGYVKSFAEKVAVERAVKRVTGVRGIAEELQIRFASDAKSADHEIAERILKVFDWNDLIPAERLQVTVEKGWVTLSGTVTWNYQREEAAKTVGKISGIKGISNHIEVDRKPALQDVRHHIEAAFRRQADLDCASVTIAIEGNKVKLGGTVRSWHERKVAENAAWSVPGVTRVEDTITMAF